MTSSAENFIRTVSTELLRVERSHFLLRQQALQTFSRTVHIQTLFEFVERGQTCLHTRLELTVVESAFQQLSRRSLCSCLRDLLPCVICDLIKNRPDSRIDVITPRYPAAGSSSMSILQNDGDWNSILNIRIVKRDAHKTLLVRDLVIPRLGRFSRVNRRCRRKSGHSGSAILIEVSEMHRFFGSLQKSSSAWRSRPFV